MKYPDEFTQKVKKTFPDWERLHKSLDSGSIFVGRYLDDSRIHLKAKTVLEYLDNDDLGGLRNLANRQVLVAELYSEWSRMYDAYLGR